MKSLAAILISPLLCVCLLVGIALQQRTRLRPDAPVVRQYHDRALAAINAMPPMVSIDGIQWSAEARKAEAAAVKLLKPNVILSRHYVEGVYDRYPRTADLLIVQCRDSRDMTGHYPPICYKNIGYELYETKTPEPVQVGTTRVPYTPYSFQKWSQGQPLQLCIYNFFVVPGRGVVRDIKGVHQAAEDYERRFFGAAQFQVLIPLNVVPQLQDRDRIFLGLLESRPGLIETLINDGLSQ
jgi:hypothetical protein